MRTTLKHTLAACIALGALMLTGTACTQDDPLGGNNPAGTQLLQLGKVTIAGTTTATRSADAATRADIAPDATTGYTGIRKHAFVAGDELVLTLNNSKGGTNTVTAKLEGTTWKLPQRTYFTAGTTIDALYTPATGKQPGGIRYSDDLVAINQDMNTDGTPLALVLTHANAMVEVTPPASLTAAGTTYTNLTISATPADPSGNGSSPQQPEALATAQEGTGNDLRHRTIAPAGATLKSISLTVNTVVYTAPIDPPVQVAANKRYPITLKMSAEEGLTASVAEGTDWGVGGGVNGYPTGLTYYISTPADLVKLRDDVNAGTAIGADVTVLQTADIDMAGVDWTPIGTNDYDCLKGSYNGNGYSIKNLTINKSYDSKGFYYIGLFGVIKGAKITGVHIRDCNIKCSGGEFIYAGALVGRANDGNIVTLCSATGSIEVTGAQYAYAGGLVGEVAASTTPNHYTRCSANVTVTTNATTGGHACGFTGNVLNSAYYAGCIASGKVTVKGAGESSGFSYMDYTSSNYHAIGCITNSEVVNDNGVATSAFGKINTLRGCLATGTYGNLVVAATESTSNVHLNTLGTGTQANATDDTAYAILANPSTSLGNAIMMKSLHYSKAKGYTTDVVDIYHWYAKGIWQNNGAKRPTIDMSYEGNPNPITHNKVYRVKDYYVTAPEAEDVKYLWNGNTGSTSMAKDPCKSYGNWLMPTMEDFEAMAGWTGTSNAWNNAVSATPVLIDDYINFRMAFPIGYSYWSSTPNTNMGEAAKAWCFRTAVNGTSGSYETELKTANYRVRCVQKQAFPTP